MALAYVALAYALASVGYLGLTRTYGTPFLDSLTPEQRRLKERSSRARASAFRWAMGLAVVVLLGWKPLG